MPKLVAPTITPCLNNTTPPCVVVGQQHVHLVGEFFSLLDHTKNRLSGPEVVSRLLDGGCISYIRGGIRYTTLDRDHTLHGRGVSKRG